MGSYSIYFRYVRFKYILELYGPERMPILGYLNSVKAYKQSQIATVTAQKAVDTSLLAYQEAQKATNNANLANLNAQEATRVAITNGYKIDSLNNKVDIVLSDILNALQTAQTSIAQSQQDSTDNIISNLQTKTNALAQLITDINTAMAQDLSEISKNSKTAVTQSTNAAHYAENTWYIRVFSMTTS